MQERMEVNAENTALMSVCAASYSTVARSGLSVHLDEVDCQQYRAGSIIAVRYGTSEESDDGGWIKLELQVCKCNWHCRLVGLLPICVTFLQRFLETTY